MGGCQGVAKWLLGLWLLVLSSKSPYNNCDFFRMIYIEVYILNINSWFKNKNPDKNFPDSFF